MTSTDIEMFSLEPLSNQESPATVDSTIKSNSATNLLDPQATVDVSDDSPATSSRIILSPIKGAVLFAIFTCIVMLIGILIVYFNSPKPPGKLCTITLKSEAQNSISDDSHPQSIAIGDFNNDIRPDIVVSNSNTNTIGVFLRNDSHSFKDQQTYSTGYGSLPYAVSVGDFNNDQRLDIAVANFGTNNIGIFLGIGNGQFRSQKIFTTESSRPRWIAVGDINNDTQLDLVVVNYGTNDVGILLGDGYGNFGKPVVFSTGFDSMPYFLAIADLDNDGYLDIAVANHGTRNIGLFFGRGNGTLTNQIIFNIGISSYPYSIAADDLNNDTYKDIVVACSGYTNSIHVLLGFGNRTYANSNNYLIGNSTSSAVSVVIGDFNNDDIYDIAVNNYAHDSISVFFGSGDGIFLDEATIYSSYGSKPYAIIAGDFNNDTRLDLAAVNYDYNYIDIILVYRNYSFLSQTIYPTSDIDTQPNSIVFADMNNDHQLDIVVTNFWSDNIGIYLNEGNNTFSNQTTYSTNSDSGPSSVITGDFNNDDQLDILVTNQNLRAIGIFLGNSSGIFSNQTTYSINAQPVSVATGDFNDDNRPDVVIVDSTSNIIGVLLALEDGTFSSQTTYSTGKDSLPSAITIGDFNNDKQLDIVVANYLGRNIGIFFGYGNGSFSSQQTYSTGQDSSPISVVASDVNGDKVLDIIVANYDMNNIGILFGYSNISFSLQYSYSTGNNSNPYCIIVDDVNNDTNPDIIVANYQIGNIGIFLGNQDGTFSIQTTYSTGITSNPKSITIGDVNNDGWADIAVANYGAANIGILSGYGNGSFTDQKTLSSKSGTTPFSLAMGDFNNDNQLDIIVANYQGNNVDIFFGYSDGSFGDRRSYSTGSDSKPFAVATADFNNDNQLDFVVANRESNSISIFFGYANVTFSLQGTYSTGSDSEPYTIAIGDLNNDKRLDVVVANAKADNIGIFLNYDNGSFSAQQTYSTGDGSFPIDVAIDDFNNDNILDIAVANRETSTLGIFLGQNNTSFSNQTSYSIGIATSPGGLAISDLDNDGYLDIVITATYASCINIFLGYGNGKFFPSDKYLTGGGSRPGSCTIADWNHDNVQDVIVTNCVTNTIGVLVGFGDGTFSNAITYSTGSNSCPNSIVAGDFNNDSLLDVVVANSGAANIGVFLGSTYMDGVRENTYFTGSSPHPEVVGVGHFNNDTYLDIAISNYGLGTVGILLGSINGTFPLQTMFSTGTLSYPTSIVISDLDDDSQLDIAVTSSGGESVGILFSNGNGNFQDLNIYPTGLGSIPSSITIGDFNNDKKLDLVIANSGTNTVQTLLKYNIEAFRTQKRYSTSSQSAPQVVLVGDFNNDSRWDFVAVNTGLNNIGVFLGLENNTFSNQKTYTTGEKSSPYAAVVADVNNDNYLDIIVTNYWNDNVGVFLGFGDGNFADQVTYPTGSGSRPINLIIADFNHDTHLDIVVALHYIDKIGFFFGYGNGSFPTMSTCSAGSHVGPISIDVGDFNDDNNLDFAVANYLHDNINIFSGYGNGSFSMPIPYSTGLNSNPTCILVADLDKDSRLDIITANSGANNIGVLFGRGNSTFSELNTFSTGTGSAPNAIAIMDFNNDNQLDIAVANYGSDNVGILLGCINGTFFSQLTYPTGDFSSPLTIAVADFNNDSYLDIVSSNSGTDCIGMLLGYATEDFLIAPPYSTGSLSQPLSLVANDFNNDTFLDVVVANNGTNNIMILFGSGYGTFSSQVIYSTGITSHSCSVAIGDFNNDHRMDIVVANSGEDNIGIYLSNGSGTFLDQTTYFTGLRSQPYSVVVVDFDNDTRLDIAVANYGSSSIGAFFGYGNGSFANQLIFNTGYRSHPFALAIGDVNNDNLTDIIATNNGYARAARLRDFFFVVDGGFAYAHVRHSYFLALVQRVFRYSKNIDRFHSPAYIMISDLSDNFQTSRYSLLHEHSTYFQSTRDQYIDLFDKDRLVYLTPDSPNKMTHFDHNAVYIVGGIYDDQNKEPLTYEKLPLEKYFTEVRIKFLFLYIHI